MKWSRKGKKPSILNFNNFANPKIIFLYMIIQQRKLYQSKIILFYLLLIHGEQFPEPFVPSWICSLYNPSFCRMLFTIWAMLYYNIDLLLLLFFFYWEYVVHILVWLVLVLLIRNWMSYLNIDVEVSFLLFFLF